MMWKAQASFSVCMPAHPHCSACLCTPADDIFLHMGTALLSSRSLQKMPSRAGNCKRKQCTMYNVLGPSVPRAGLKSAGTAPPWTECPQPTSSWWSETEETPLLLTGDARGGNPTSPFSAEKSLALNATAPLTSAGTEARVIGALELLGRRQGPAGCLVWLQAALPSTWPLAPPSLTEPQGEMEGWCQPGEPKHFRCNAVRQPLAQVLCSLFIS